MKSLISRGAGLLAALLVGTAALTCASPASAKAVPQNNKNKPVPSPTPAAATTYSGRATAVQIDDVEVPIPGPIILADTGPLAASGGVLEASEANYELLGTDGVTVAIGVELAYATVAGSGPETSADGNLTTFEVRMDTPANGRVTITADYIGASASAAIGSNGSLQTEGSISVNNLIVNGAAVNVTGAVNQTVAIPGGKIVFNEQTVVNANGRAEITIVAMHVYIDGCMNGAFGRVTAGITAGNAPPPPRDDHDCGKLTGGGWIVGPSGAKATFGVSGGIRRGEFWGHLTYIDHGTGLSVKSTRVTNYIPNPSVPDCRTISYDVEINGLPGTAVVDAWDKGEPGRDDFFAIRLSTGYRASGTLGGDGPGGGNLQLHKCPPGWDK
jgi:hypothetical protein